MKKLFKSINVTKSLLVGALLLGVVSLKGEIFASSKVIAVVGAVKGMAFYSKNGKTMALKQGTHLPAGAEIFTEEGSQVTLNDYYDHIYHLSGSGHMVLFKNLVELKEGYLWVQALTRNELIGDFMITTANAQTSYSKGEGIFSFDSYSGKTQILAVKGSFDFQNILQAYKKINVREGQFSFIQNDFNEGSPRRATPIGFGSYQKVTGLFHDVQSTSEKYAKKSKRLAEQGSAQASFSNSLKNTAKRGIASESERKESAFERALKKKMNRGVSAEKSYQHRPVHKAPKDDEEESDKGDHDKRAGKTTILREHDPVVERAKSEQLMNYYQAKVKVMARPKLKKRWKPEYNQKSNVSLKIFGSGNHRVTKATKKDEARRPASRKRMYKKAYYPKKTTKKEEYSKKSAPRQWKKVYGRGPASIGGMVPTVNKANAFESQLVEEYKTQMRHDSEVNHLIDELKSVDMDYKKDY